MLSLSPGSASLVTSRVYRAGHRQPAGTGAACLPSLHQSNSQRRFKISPQPRLLPRKLPLCFAAISRTTSSRSGTRSERGGDDEPLTKYDIDFWHYQPWWWQPRTIVIAGLSTIAAAGFFTEEHLRSALWASLPVGLMWHIFLRILPTQFRSNAVQYLETHDMEDAM